MNAFQLYLWMNDNQPVPFEVQKLYCQLGDTISNDQAWVICHLHDAQCTGPYGRGYNHFVAKLGKFKLLPSHDSTSPAFPTL